MNSKAEMAEIIRKYIEIKKGPSVKTHGRFAYLKVKELEQLSPGQSTGWITPFSMLKVKCAKPSGCSWDVYGYYPRGETPAADYSNFVIPPLCGEHLLEAAETLDQLLVQALLSLDQKIVNQKIVTRDKYAGGYLPSTNNRCWPPRPPGKAKNRME